MNEEYIASPGCQQERVKQARGRKMCLKAWIQPNSKFNISVVGVYLELSF